MRILVVCSGNICRSPVAEELFRHEAKLRGVEEHFEVKSCGTLGISGENASVNSVIVATEYGVDIASFLSSAATRELSDWADRIYCLAENHLSYFKNMSYDKKLSLLSPKNVGILDPYGHDIRTYRNCIAEISEAVTARMDELCELL